MSETLTLTKIHNSIDRTDRDVVQWVYVPGQSLAEVRASLPTDVLFAVSLNGVTVPEGRLVEVFPCAGDHILFVPLIAGGSDGKQIARIVGMIVVAAAAMYLTGGAGAGFLQGALSTSMPFVNGLIAGSLMVAGGLVVNAVLPPPKARATGVSAENSQAYSWSPQTIQQQGIPVPRWYGTNKLYGNIIGGYIESDGDKQYLNALVDLGIGPFATLTDKQININDQPLSNFKGIPTVILKQGFLNQSAVDNFQTTVVEHALSQKITVVNSPYAYTPSGATYEGLEIEVSFPNGLFSVNASTGAYENQSVDIKIEITNGVDNHTLTVESNNVTYQDKLGWSLGKWIEIQSFATNPNVIVGKAWFGGEPDGNQRAWLDSGDVGLGWVPYHNEGEVDATTGLMWHYFGALQNDGISYDVESVPWSSGQTLYSTVVSNSSKVKRRIWRVFGLSHDTWDVKITRLTADNISTTISNDFYLTAVREIVMIPFQYPRHALVGIRSLATDTLSGSLRFSTISDCLYVRTWDGTSWVIQFSNNPAWVLFDVLTQPVYSGDTPSTFAVVRYDGINPSRLDLVKFKEWADYCDELVPNGVGIETEKRITFNGGFDAETNLWDAAMTVCQVGGAVLVWNGVKLTLAIDKPADPVQLFSVGNTGVDSFTETFVSMEDRAAEIEVDFTNSENDYKRDKVTITNANITTIASKVGLQMVGVTKASEAWRIAKKRLLYNELITRTVSWKADIDAIACTVGDVVLLQSDIPQWGQGGRLVSATTTQVVLDQAVTIVPAITYSVMVRIADDTIVERTVSNAPGTTDTLTVTSAFTTAPSAYDVYAFGISTQEAKPFRISSIQKSGDLEATLSAVEYNADIYDDAGNPVLPVVNYSQLEAWPTFTNLVLAERVVKLAGGGISNVVDVAYDNVSDASTWPKVELLVSEAGAAFVSAGAFIINEPASFTVAQGLSYRVVVRAINSIGEFQPVSSGISGVITAAGQDTPPANVSGFTATFAGNLFKLVWTPNTEFDLAGYEIRTGASWAAGTVLQASWLGNAYTYRPTASGAVTFWIKAFDTAGNESTTAVTSSATVPTADVPTAIMPISQFLEIDLDITFDTTRQDTLHVEIWAASTNDRNLASSVGISKEKRWKHRDLTNGTVRYYWTRIVTVFGETGSWYPSGATSGVMGSALNDPSQAVKLLNPDITDASIAAYLANNTPLLSLMDTRSMLFELGVVGPGVTATFTDALSQAASQMNANQTLLQSLNAIVSGLVVTAYDAEVTYTVGMIVTYLGDSYQCILTSTDNLPTDTTYWSPISGLYDLVNTIQQNLDAATATFTSTAHRINMRVDDLSIANYSATVDYLVDELVKWTDSYYYKCLLPTGPTSPNTVHDPTNATYWQLSASVGRVTVAETNITQNADQIALTGESIIGPLAFVAGIVEAGVQIESVADVKGLEVQVSRTGIVMDTANANIALHASRLDTAEGRLSQAEIDIDGANGLIALKASISSLDALTGVVSLKATQISLDAANAQILLRATSSELTSSINVLSDLIGISLSSPGATYTPGMTLTWSDASHTKSLVRFDTSSFQIGNTVATAYSGTRAYLVDELVTYSSNTYRCKLASTGNVPTNTTYWTLATGLAYRPVFGVGNIAGSPAVGISGDLFIDGTVSASKLVADSAMVTFLNAQNITAGLVSADNIIAGTVTGSTLRTAANGKRFIVDSSTNEARFYDTDGTSLLTSIGINSSYDSTNFPDLVIGLFGNISVAKTAIGALSASNYGTIISDGKKPFVASGIGTIDYAYSVNWTGSRTVGTHRKGFTGKGQLLLCPNWDSGAPTHNAQWGAVYLDADCVMYVQRSDPNGTDWQKVGAQ